MLCIDFVKAVLRYMLDAAFYAPGDAGEAGSPPASDGLRENPKIFLGGQERMKKRIMAALLAVMMLAALLPTAAFAAAPSEAAEKLPTPELSAWEEDSGIISWGIADSYSEYLDDYYLKVRYKEAEEAEAWTEITATPCDLYTVFSPSAEGYFQVQVQAKSKSPAQYADSEWSDWSGTYHRGPIDQDFLNTIGGQTLCHSRRDHGHCLGAGECPREILYQIFDFSSGC